MKRALPSHGTVIAYVALFLALAGSGYAVDSVTGGGPTVVTQAPAYTIDPHNNPNYLTPPAYSSYLEDEYTVAEDSNPVTNALDKLEAPLQSPSKIAGGTAHLASVQFCINISGNTNPQYQKQSVVKLVKAAVYQLNEANPGGGPGSGTPNGAPPYSAPVVLLQKTYNQAQIDNCPTLSSLHPAAVNRNGYLELVVTVGLTTPGGSPYGTNYVQMGRVTTTYTP